MANKLSQNIIEHARGAHIVEDFMDVMCNAGYLEKKEVKDGNDNN